MTVWNINSTARGGGVAEMLRSLVPYARGAGVDVRWVVIDGPPEFFRVTKRLHHALHGSCGDASPLDDAARETYEKTLRGVSIELRALVRPGDVAILHDPQTAGLIPSLARSGVRVVWRCHVGSDTPNDEVESGWRFLAPYLESASATVFSRESYIPPGCGRERAVVISPSIDPFSAKNQELDAATCRAILVRVGIIEGPPGAGFPGFVRDDGSPGRVDRGADLQHLGRAPRWDTPLVVQVSRWDALKDPVGVLNGFASLTERDGGDAELVLAGPNVHAVTDDPEGAQVYDEVCAAWRALPHAARRRVHLASLPMTDVAENGAIVNALQRHATVVVQKSLQEGFGLVVSEAMWKGRAVVASAVGGIQDQIEHGVSGLLLKDPTDLGAFADAIERLLLDPAERERLGQNAQRRVREHFLGPGSLLAYAGLIGRLGAASPRTLR